MSEVKHTHSVSQIAAPGNRTEIIRDLCREAHREAAANSNLEGLKPLGYFAAKVLCEKVWDIAAQQSSDSHEELVEALKNLPLDSFGDDMSNHDAAEFVDHAGEFFEAMIAARAALAKAGRP